MLITSQGIYWMSPRILRALSSSPCYKRETVSLGDSLNPTEAAHAFTSHDDSSHSLRAAVQWCLAKMDAELSTSSNPTPEERKEQEEHRSQVFFDAENSEHEGSLPSLPASPDPQHAQDHHQQQSSKNGENQESAHNRSNANNPDSVLLATLRLQIADLNSQVTSLNGKLVDAYDRIGDLEDHLDRSEGRSEYLRRRTAALEQERKQWEERVERGLLVEKVPFIVARGYRREQFQVSDFVVALIVHRPTFKAS